MRYIATKPGFINNHRVEAGQSFESKPGLKGKWFVAEAEYKPAAVEQEPPEPNTLSEMSRQTSRGPITRKGDKTPL